MRNWKWALIGATVVTVVIGTIVHHKFNAFKHDGDALAATKIDSQQPVSTDSRPTTEAAAHATSNASDAPYGWGPFRTVDW